MRNLQTVFGKLLYINAIFWLAVAVNTLVYYYVGDTWGFVAMILNALGLLGWWLSSPIRVSGNLGTGLLILMLLGYPLTAYVASKYIYYSNGSLVEKGLTFEEVFQGQTKYVFFDANDFKVDARTTGYVYKLHKARKSNSSDRPAHYYVIRLINAYGWNKNSVWLVASSRKELKRLKKTPQKFFVRETSVTKYTIKAVKRALKTDSIPKKMIFVSGSTDPSISHQGRLYGKGIFYGFLVVNVLLIIAFGIDKKEERPD